ncbi:MAG: D-glycero-beta-D-manno-heptose 1-phosphate adenylyltransferase [Cytophagales bacterium]|nr:D-glycero-beta-D-manno-heptose 1-phosphate adenylyltransferase [Cytophagales bacterium]MDW8384487.1 D-glycero-beta-D-manno-heptose 1-phosphate adenylyltransferase [Flammeovirgaceae bacterium]
MSNTAKKIFPNTTALAEQVRIWQAEGKKVVFTNGCFDILHLGHVDYLEKAAQLGNKLVVGVNTDASVKKLKGNHRPINNEYARCRVLAALAFTDAIILFDEDTPLQLIQTLLPDVLVKGADYKVENIVGADVVLSRGGEVKTIEFVEGYSTTNIIAKMKTP